MSMRRVACLVVQSFSTLSHKLHDLRQNVIDHKVCDLIFYKILPETFLILRKKKSEI